MTLNRETETANLERLRIKAKNEIGEKEELIPEYIAKVRAIIAADPVVCEPPENYDYFILRCLRARKYNVERAAKTFKKFCKVRVDVSDMSDLMIPSCNKELYKKNFVSVLKSKDSLGRHIIFIRLDQWNASKHSFDNVLAALFLMLDDVMESIDAQLNGLVVVVNFKGLGLSHARQIGPSRLQALFSIIQDSYPARFKELHFLNHPSIFNMLFAIAKPFIKEKMRKRIYFHGYDTASLHKNVNPAILPTNVGGNLNDDEVSDQELVAKLLQKDEHYKDFLAVFARKNS